MALPLTSIFNHPSRWTQLAFARDKDGHEASPTVRRATCWCLVGALSRSGLSVDLLREVSARVYPNMEDWNDHPDRTFADVRELAEKVDRALGLKIHPLLT